MNQFIWIGIIVWGILVMGFGMATVEPVAPAGRTDPAHDVLFLLTGGLLSCLIGMLGLCGLDGMGCRGFAKKINLRVMFVIERLTRAQRPILDSRRRHGRSTNQPEDTIMLYTIAVVLIILWLLGLVTSYTVGGFIHILLVVAVIMILVRLISGRGI